MGHQWTSHGNQNDRVSARRRESAAGVTPGLPCGCDALSPSAAAGIGGLLSHASFQPEQRQSFGGRIAVAFIATAAFAASSIRRIGSKLTNGLTVRAQDASPNEFIPAFKRSIHICVVDAGDCGACLNEVKQLNNPYYNMHRLGFFITPSPRHADVLLVVGPVTDHMRVALKKIYDAMPTPKRVVAVGACALTGGVFAESFVCANGVAEFCRWTWKCREIRRRLWPFCTACSWRLDANQRRCSMRHRQSWKPMRRNSDGNANAHPCLFLLFAARAFCCRWRCLRSRQGNVLAWLGCLGGDCLGVGGREMFCWRATTFRQPLWSLPGLATLTVKIDRLSAVFLFVTGLVLFPASIFAGGELNRRIGAQQWMRVHRADVRTVCVHRFDFYRGRRGAVSARVGSHVHSFVSADCAGAGSG